MTHTERAQRQPVVALLTDFGVSDGYVGIMKGVMLGIAPTLTCVDLTHEVPPQDIATGAWILQMAWRYFPTETVFLCVVDPGVGSARRGIALRCAGRTFVGPDNGLFDAVLAAGEPVEARLLDRAHYHLPTPSATFHGRDIFAPSAAHLASGLPFAEIGSPIDAATLTRLALPPVEWHGASVIGHIRHIDHFGNIITDLDPDLTALALETPGTALALGTATITARATTFAEGPAHAPFLLRDSSGHLAIAIRQGSAAEALAARVGMEVVVTGLPEPTHNR